MKKKLTLSFLIIVLLFFVVSCDFKNKNNNEYKNSNEVISSMKVIINGNEYIVKLENNETVRSLINLLPLEFTMNELNGNEKYANIDKSLPTNSFYPDRINKGDVYLFGNDCIVIFYESFVPDYSYTKIGHIDNLPDLGNGDVSVKFE